VLQADVRRGHRSAVRWVSVQPQQGSWRRSGSSQLPAERHKPQMMVLQCAGLCITFACKPEWPIAADGIAAARLSGDFQSVLSCHDVAVKRICIYACIAERSLEILAGELRIPLQFFLLKLSNAVWSNFAKLWGDKRDCIPGWPNIAGDILMYFSYISFKNGQTVIEGRRCIGWPYKKKLDGQQSTPFLSLTDMKTVKHWP
jgi:hypothetical protein